MLITPAQKRLEQEDCEFNTSLGDFELHKEKKKGKKEKNIRAIIVKKKNRQTIESFYLEELIHGIYKICAIHLHSQHLY